MISTGLGFGTAATGGLGKPVYYVTNTSPGEEAGSFRHCLNQSRDAGGIIRFDSIGGVIDYSVDQNLRLEIPSHVTLAGETADDVPGKPPGITIYGASVLVGRRDGEPVENVIVRHVRFRGPSPNGLDCFELFRASRVLVQHCSMVWGRDGTFDVAECNQVTVEYCIVAETLLAHSMGMVVKNKPGTDGRITIHHNLLASHRARHPFLVAAGDQPNLVEVYNNVVYNWGENGTHTAKGHDVRANIVGNWYRKGPSTKLPKYAVYIRKGARAYVPDQPAIDANVFDDGVGPAVWESGSTNQNMRVPDFWPTMEPESAESAKRHVLKLAGPHGDRDCTDYRLIREAVTGTGSIKSAPPDYELDILSGVKAHPACYGSVSIDPELLAGSPAA